MDSLSNILRSHACPSFVGSHLFCSTNQSSLFVSRRPDALSRLDAHGRWHRLQRWNTGTRQSKRVDYHDLVTASVVEDNSSQVDVNVQLGTTQQRKKPQRYYETFEWRGFNINYRAEGPASGKPVLFVHGFGASVNHWRKNIPAVLETEDSRVYAIDLLGLGASSKASPKEVTYGIDLWRDQITDFIDYMNTQTSSSSSNEQQWTLIGNSIGSLVSLSVAEKLGPKYIRSMVLMNCAGGLVSFRYSELNVVQRVFFFIFNALFLNPIVGRYLFDSIRKPEQLCNVLKQIYINEEAISDDLVDILSMPAYDEGALQVFLAILNGDPGPEPEKLLEKIQWCPILVIWGEKDPWTPLDTGFHPGKDFPQFHNRLILKTIPNAGHCIHDEVPDAVNPIFVPFIQTPTFRNE